MTGAAYKCRLCGIEVYQSLDEDAPENCVNLRCRSRVMVRQRTSPSHTFRHPKYRYQRHDVVEGRVFIDLPTPRNSSPGQDAENKISLLRRAILAAKDGAANCHGLVNRNTKWSKMLLARWFHNVDHQYSCFGQQRLAWIQRVQQVFSNVKEALETGLVTFAVAAPDNAWAKADPNSPGFTWPPELNQILRINDAAGKAQTVGEFNQLIAGLPNFRTGSGMRIVVTEKFFSDDPIVRASTIIHELTHKTSNTLDMQYGPWACHLLAVEEPFKAVENADNYTFFAEQVMGRRQSQIFFHEGSYVPPPEGFSAEGF